MADTHPGAYTKAERRRTVPVIRDPISVDQALRYYISFYETAEKYRDSYVLGLFEDVTGTSGG